MSKIIDGYPDYLIKVDHHRMRILVNAECVPDKSLGTLVNDEEYDDGEQWIAFAGKYEICPNCNGKGTHVNRAIDGNGLSAEDFAEDPDFAESYRSGDYDVSCDECGGRRVIMVPATPEGAAIINKVMSEHRAGEAESRAERMAEYAFECRLGYGE